MHRFRSHIARSPWRALVLGKILLVAGAILIVGAVFARAGLVSTNADRAEAKLPALRTLGQAYPQYPTGVVPEGPVGFTLSALLVLAGLGLVLLAEDAARRERARRGRAS